MQGRMADTETSPILSILYILSKFPSFLASLLSKTAAEPAALQKVWSAAGSAASGAKPVTPLETAKNPRICLLTNSFYPIIGGGETHALLLCREWLKRGVTVTVLTRRVTRNLKCEENLDGLTIRRLPPAGFRRFGKYLVTIPAYFELIQRRNEYDVIYVCGLRVAGIPATLAALRLGKICVLRAESRGEYSGDFIWNSPDPAIRETSMKPLIRMYLKWRNRILLKAQAFVSISQDVHDEFLKEGIPAQKVRKIFNGIDTSRFEPLTGDKQQIREKLGLPAGKKIFTYSGKLNKGKGLEMLLRVWKKLAAERSDCHLVLVGGGGKQFLSCEQELRDYADSNSLQDRITFAGFQTEMFKYLQAADYFAFPSENEALSIALLEALACELPCLASDISGNRDIANNGQNGLLLPVNDESAWLAAMRSVLDDPAGAIALGKAGRCTVIEKFSISKVADQHLELFRSLVAAAGDKPA